MAPNVIPFVMVPLMAFAVWRRVRGTFGRQPIQRRRMTTRIAIFSVIALVIALGGLQNPSLLEGLFGGILGGGVLGLVGLRLTRFERDANGADAYYPNPWIGGLLTVLLLARMGWRFFVLMPSMEGTAAAQSAPSAGNSALTFAVFGLLIGYYVVYFTGLLVHHRRFEREQAASSTP